MPHTKQYISLNVGTRIKGLLMRTVPPIWGKEADSQYKWRMEVRNQSTAWMKLQASSPVLPHLKMPLRRDKAHTNLDQRDGKNLCGRKRSRAVTSSVRCGATVVHSCQWNKLARLNAELCRRRSTVGLINWWTPAQWVALKVYEELWVHLKLFQNICVRTSKLTEATFACSPSVRGGFIRVLRVPPAVLT